MTANSALKFAIGTAWPLQKAQSTGAKLKPKQRISPTNGCDMGCSSVPARENANERNAKADAQRRHQIAMGLVIADGRAYACRQHMRDERWLAGGRRIGVQIGTTAGRRPRQHGI